MGSMLGEHNILVLYSSEALAVNAVKDSVEAFGDHFPCRVTYEAVDARGTLHSYQYDRFDAIIVHYSASFHYGYFRDSLNFERLCAYDGPVAVFSQDDYDRTDRIKDGLRRLSPRLFFTVVPDQSASLVFAEFSGIRILNCLTGFVPERLENFRAGPIADRPIHVGYRGRLLPAWFGELGLEKVVIGRKMRGHCRERLVPCDIEWEETKRIYGAAWDEFLASCRTVLGTESGCNVFDFDGSIRAGVIAAKRRDRSLTAEQLYEVHVRSHEGAIARTNQISPKYFEAIARGTGLVLFEGHYSGLLKPDEHFIPLAKDFSNIDDVLRRIDDAAGVEEMADRAHRDLIASGKYSYRSFAQWVYAELSKELAPEPRAAALEIQEGLGSLPRGRVAWIQFCDMTKQLAWGCGRVIEYAREWGWKSALDRVAAILRRMAAR